MRATLPLPEPPLTDGVVTVRAWHDGDAPAAATWGRDPEIVRWTDVPVDQSEQLAREYVAETELARRAGLTVALAIADGRSDALLGACDVRRPDPTDPAIGELGYLLAGEARGRGLATRAIWLLTDWSFRELGMHSAYRRSYIPITPASVRLLERLGFTREGVLRRYRRGDRCREDRAVYAVLPGELVAIEPAGC